MIGKVTQSQIKNNSMIYSYVEHTHKQMYARYSKTQKRENCLVIDCVTECCQFTQGMKEDLNLIV